MGMKKGALILGGVLLLIVVLIFIVRFAGGWAEDGWICVNGEWVKHGNPASPMPESGCGNAGTPATSFSAMGNLVKDNPGLTPGTWYLVYEKPGNPAAAAALSFDASSSCTLSGRVFPCTEASFTAGDRVTVDGIENGGVVNVVSLIDESSTKALSSCPEWVNCMPGPDVGTRCIIPPGCENITQKAY
jgi:hypothetical protein